MTKTENQIERDFYDYVKNSTLGKSLQGDVYRAEMRPYDAKTEDLVVKFLSGIDEQVQEGVVIFNLYVPDIAHSDGRMVRNMERIGELESMIQEFVNNAGENEYWLSLDATPITMRNQEIEQHFIYSRINFKRV